MKIKVSEATPHQLNWLVAKCEGTEICAEHGWSITEILRAAQAGGYHRYSTNWAQGGPIIEREYLTIEVTDELPDAYYSCKGMFCLYGPTPLITAMRCYVASKMGNEVDVPEELT